jgi:cellulose synthase/poly-beta-1,6-N-acetylglucosamine synthase-like glycosyltransferase
MNAGLKRATGEIALCFDADYYPQRDIVEKLVREFVDLSVGAVQGRPVVWNEAQNAVTRLVRLERIGGYRVYQEARDNLGLIPQFGGTTWGFRRPRALRSKKLNVKEKIDGLLLLHAYFMPVLTLVAFVAGVSLIIAHS